MGSFITLAILSVVAAQAASKEFVCYWESWSIYRAEPYKHSFDKIPTDLCTHVIYAFAGLDPSSWRITSLDSWLDIDNGGFNQFVALKKKNPDLNVSLAVGGWFEDSGKYSQMVADPAKRKTFISSIVDWIKTYKFDGLDFHWEFPARKGGAVDDKQNLNSFLQEMRSALDSIDGKKYLTIAVPSISVEIDVGYDVPIVSTYCDFIHVMTYDLRSPDHDGITGNHNALYSGAADKGWFREWNVAQGMKNWANAGAPRSKLIMGIAFYGKTFTLQNPSNNGVGALSYDPGTQGSVSTEAGTLFYFEICERLKQGWTRKFDNERKVPYAFSGRQWVGYEDVEGIKYKMEVIIKEGYGGAMTWAIGSDDHANVCGDGAYPLANAVVKGLNEEIQSTS